MGKLDLETVDLVVVFLGRLLTCFMVKLEVWLIVMSVVYSWY